MRFFEGVHAYATAGGRDQAKLYDSVRDDVFYGDPIQAALYRPGTYFNRAKHFEAVHAYATAGGQDQARLHGSDENDIFYADPIQGALYNPAHEGEYRSGFYNRVKSFPRVKADAHQGDEDRADLHDSPSSDLLEAGGNWVRLSNAAVDFLYEAEAFDFVKTTASTSGNRKVLPELFLLKFDLELDGLW